MKFRDIVRRALPYVVAVVVFWAVSAAYFAPQFAGKSLAQTDVQMYEGMKKDISEHRAEFDEDPQWTGGMFGGMPAYLITVQYPAMFLRNVGQWAMNLMGEPAALMMLAMLGFWLMLLMAGVNPWVAIVPAIAYGLSTYNILIIEAGHITKMRAMGWAPMLVGAVFWTFQRNIWVAGGLAALFGALTIAASHHQITYYFLLVLFAYWIGQLVITTRARAKKAWWKFCKATGVLGFAAVLAVGANFSHLWYTAEHTPETIRGGSEMTADDGTGRDYSGTKGLDLEYATAWSYGIGESVNMLIPNFRGGGSSGGFETNGEVANILRRSGINPSIATQLPGYWGDQPFTGGPTYIGAVMVFLFVLGLFVLPGRQKWWIMGVSAVGLLLAWGSNAMWFTQLSFSVLPGYNKFRTVAMALVVLQWAIPFVAALVMAGLWKGDFSGLSGLSGRRFKRGFLWAIGLTGGLALLFAMFGGVIYDFSAAGDEQFSGVPGLVEAMQNERAAMFRADCWRSLIFVVLTAGVVWLWARRRSEWFVAALGVLVLADLVPVDLRYLSHSDFRARERVQVVADEADKIIMADPELGFRVLNTQNPFNEAFTSYFHRSVGGYHGAKLRRYQDVIDRYLSKFDLGVLNMLNTKYIIDANRQVELNPEANGAAWIVEEIVFVNGAREELEALGTIDNKRQAVVGRNVGSELSYAENSHDQLIYGGEGAVQLVEYRPNYLRYESSTATGGLVVFSEIYYNKSWTAYIDGQPTDYIRADYILRAMEVPAGEHTIEWRFRAPNFNAVEGVTLATSIAILLWVAAAAGVPAVRKKLKSYGTRG